MNSRRLPGWTSEHFIQDIFGFSSEHPHLSQDTEWTDLWEGSAQLFPVGNTTFA